MRGTRAKTQNFRCANKQGSRMPCVLLNLVSGTGLVTGMGAGGFIATESLPRVRPRFELESEATPEVVLGAFRAQIEKRPGVRGRVYAPDRVELLVAAEDAHAWSPQVTLRVSPTPRGGSFIAGRVGPAPQVWTLYATLYGLSALGVLVAIVFGLTQWFLGGRPYALIGIPAAMAFSTLVYGASFVGQGLGSEQTYRLRRFVEEILRNLEEPG